MKIGYHRLSVALFSAFLATSFIMTTSPDVLAQHDEGMVSFKGPHQQPNGPQAGFKDFKPSGQPQGIQGTPLQMNRNLTGQSPSLGPNFLKPPGHSPDANGPGLGMRPPQPPQSEGQVFSPLNSGNQHPPILGGSLSPRETGPVGNVLYDGVNTLAPVKSPPTGGNILYDGVNTLNAGQPLLEAPSTRSSIQTEPPINSVWDDTDITH